MSAQCLTRFLRICISPSGVNGGSVEFSRSPEIPAIDSPEGSSVLPRFREGCGVTRPLTSGSEAATEPAGDIPVGLLDSGVVDLVGVLDLSC